MNLLRNVKKAILLVVLSMLVIATGCTSTKGLETNAKKVGILQLTQHPALDEAREGFENQLKSINPDVQIIYQNAQGNIPNITTIAQKFVRDDVDLIFAISTPVAQTLKNITDEIPVVFTAITDPVETEIVESLENPNCNFTGTSDEAPVMEQFELFTSLDSNIKTIGVLYNTSELNSRAQVKQIEKVCDILGLKLETIGISSINELAKATDSLIKKVDAIYTPADNMIASGIQVISEKAIQNKIITIGAERAHVDGGILFTKGINYRDLGSQSANMANNILENNILPNDIPVEKSEKLEFTVNKNTLEKLNLNLDLSLFENIEVVK